MTQTVRRFRAAGLLLLAIPLAGCGLSEYERHMAEEQKRLDRLEEENKVLGDPLEYPNTRKDGDKTVYTASVFLRPPRGAENTKRYASPDLPLLYHYPVRGNPPFQEVLLLVDQTDLKSFAPLALKAYPGVELDHGVAMQVQTRGGKERRVWYLISEDGQSRHLIYLQEMPPNCVLVVYRLNKAEPASAATDQVVRMSLGTLTLGPQAADLLAAFANRKK